MADKWVLIFKQDVTVQAIQSLCVEAEAVSQGRFSGSCRRLHTGSLLKGISGGSGLLTHLLLLTVFCRPSTRLACVVYDPSASDFAGTFTAADVHRIQAAFSDSLLIVEKDGIMQVSSPVSAFYTVWFNWIPQVSNNCTITALGWKVCEVLHHPDQTQERQRILLLCIKRRLDAGKAKNFTALHQTAPRPLPVHATVIAFAHD